MNKLQAQSRQVTTVREELYREVATWRKDLEVQVKEELRKHMTSLQEGCKASIEAQVKDSLVTSDRVEKRMEEMFHEYHAQERTCKPRLTVQRQEHGSLLRLARLKHNAWHGKRRPRQKRSPSLRRTGRSCLRRERAALVAKLAQAEAQRLACSGEAKAQELASLAEDGQNLASLGVDLAKKEGAALHLTEALAARSQDLASEILRKTEEKAAQLVKQAEEPKMFN
eukprot:g24361.t1